MTTQTYYHIYNHAIGDEIFFREQTNYEFFLKQVEKYLIGEIKLHAYVLMPNHFHLMVSINEGMEEQAFHQLSKLFNSYAKAYNKFYSRRGSLFIKIFKTS